MQRSVIMVTAGEWPAARGLLVSQVLETAISLKSRGYDVSWVAAIPLLSYIKRVYLRTSDLNEIQKRCEIEGINFSYKIIPVTLGSPYSFWLRAFFHQRVASYIATKIRNKSGQIVLHARSYYAAEIGILVKNEIDSKKSIITSFDMRSLLPNEVVMGFGKLGIAFFGFFKVLEYRLLRKSDLVFLPLHNARTLIEMEAGINVRYVPIQGFDDNSNLDAFFNEKWVNKKIGYSGSIGQWHDPQLLLNVFHVLADYKPSLAMSYNPFFEGFEQKLYTQNQLKSYYDSLLALVIPGLKPSTNFYITSQMRINLFSSKASEALSRGVPLIVSAELNELATFVIKNGCGIVFDILDSKPVFREDIASLTKERWEELSINAAEAGKMFTRSFALNLYEKAWNEALSGGINNTEV